MFTKIELTAIEQQLLLALSLGATNKQLARDQRKSDFTVRNQLSSMYKKIKVSNRTHAVFWYRDYLEGMGKECRNSTSVPLHERRKFLKMSVVE